ncbi:hypothetical protein FE257_005727 [Aspergillus nanangensis]|uniref:Uncharacterized protein n=1 Tax=Aspergillus nanangensis TaxID=2582783 RepID=A0AAD4CQ35_ASPNN|nr:hypothetical protein FE257_005727 [Aspergillus nanangensis]
MAQSCEHMSLLCISDNTCNYEDACVAVEPPASLGSPKPHADLSSTCTDTILQHLICEFRAIIDAQDQRQNNI